MPQFAIAASVSISPTHDKSAPPQPVRDRPASRPCESGGVAAQKSMVPSQKRRPVMKPSDIDVSSSVCSKRAPNHALTTVAASSWSDVGVCLSPTGLCAACAGNRGSPKLGYSTERMLPAPACSQGPSACKLQALSPVISTKVPPKDETGGRPATPEGWGTSFVKFATLLLGP